jgi:hypothetical protein
MDSHDDPKHTHTGSIARVLRRLREIFAKLSPQRRGAMRKWCDALENEAKDDPSDAT